MDNDTIDTELRDVLHGMIATPDTHFDDVVAGVRRRIVRRRRNRRALAGTSLVAVVVVATVAGVVAARGSHPTRHVNVTSSSTLPATPTSDPIVTDADGVQSFGEVPLSTRSGTASVWTGSEFVVWGGSIESANAGLPGPDRQFNDGAAFNPTTRTWRPLSPSPLPPTRTTSFGVNTDDGVVVVNGRDAALWDPRTNTWRSLEKAPAAVEDLSFTGSRVISASAHALLDPKTGVWQAIPPLPALDRKAVVWTGQELFVIGGPGSAFTSAVAYAYEPTGNRWRRLADPPEKLHAEALAADWDGNRVVVVNYDMQAESYDPATDTWTTLTSVPARFSEWTPTLRSSGGDSVAFMANAVGVLNPAGEWTPLPYGSIPSLGQITATDSGALFVIGWPLGQKVDTLVALDLERLVDGARRLQVGIASVEIPSGYTLARASYDHDGNGAPVGADTVRVVLGRQTDGSCTLTSSYGNAGNDIPNATPETLVSDGKPHQWQRDATGGSWRFQTDGNIDSFKVVCSDPSTARTIAESTSFVYE
jgi:hypothetical protein